MRFRIPPFLPPYAVLSLVIAYAIAALWFGLGRLEVIARLTESNTQNLETMHDLKGLLVAVNDIETAGRGFALTADESYLEPFERGRRYVPILLSALRDKMRDDPAELALLETLVPLIAERTTISATGIERKRSAPNQPYEMTFGRRGKETSEGIRGIVRSLESREQEQLARVRQTQASSMSAARQDLYLMAGVTLLLVISLFIAVRRLRSFIPFALGAKSGATIDIATRPSSERDAGLGTLLRDAMLRARLAAGAAPAESTERQQLLALVAAMEKMHSEHDRIASERNQSPREERSVVQSLALLGETYSRRGGLTIKATIDQSVEIADAQMAFLIFRSAEWALEAIMLRKRVGDVSLQFTASGDDASLLVRALTDTSEIAVTLTPKENDEVNALNHGVTALGGTFNVVDGPTGLSLTLTIPFRSI